MVGGYLKHLHLRDSNADFNICRIVELPQAAFQEEQKQ